MPRSRAGIRDSGNSEDLNTFRLDRVIERGIPDLEERLLPHSIVRVTVKKIPWLVYAARNKLLTKMRSRFSDTISGKRVFDIYCMHAGLNSFYHEWKRDLRKHLIVEKKYLDADIPTPIKDEIMKRIYEKKATILNCFDISKIITKRADITMLVEDAERVSQYALAFLVTQSVIIVTSLINAYLSVAEGNLRKDLRYYKRISDNFLETRRDLWRQIEEQVEREVLYATWKFIKEKGAVDFSELTNWAKANDYDTDDVMMALAKLKNEVGCIRQEGLMIIYDESAHEYRLGEL